MMVKKISLILLCSLFAVSAYAAKIPGWVSVRPVDDAKYIGISCVPLSDANYREKAAKIALDEIAAQISVTTESESLLKTIVVDGRSNELFENKISQRISLELEGQKIKDSYESKTSYYVYYELDKAEYYKSIEDKRNKAINNGLDIYNKGAEAEASGNLVSAVQLYSSGLEAIEPFLNLSLTTTRNGVAFNVANELYNAYINVFHGLVITTNVKELSVEAFKSNQHPIAACISRKGRVIPNVELTAKFSAGNGSITPSVKSDVNGTSIFYLSNVTSKESIQRVTIGVGASFINSIPEAYRDLFKGVSLPTADITLALVSSNYTAYFDVESDAVPACQAQIKQLLANNYFEFHESQESDLYVSYSTSFRSGGVVAGGTFDMNECFCSLKLEIYNNKSQSMLLSYSISDMRVLVPTSQSASQAKTACARELTMRAKRELPEELKSLKFNK